MSIDRRQFLGITAATAGFAAMDCLTCLVRADNNGSTRMVDAGPVSSFAAEGVYDSFRDSGFFIIRRDGKLFALSSICPHRAVTLKAQPDCSFYCKRHGSTFAPNGHVTQGPAKRDMPVLMTSISNGHLLVSVLAT